MIQFTNSISQLFRPRNVVDPQTSAVHYNTSPYTYVLNNPLKYVDLIGLDTTKAPTLLPEITLTGQGESNNVPHWLGPGMVALGQPWVPKRFVTPGSSIASTVLNKVVPIQSPVRLPSPVINRSGMRMVATKSVGNF